VNSSCKITIHFGKLVKIQNLKLLLRHTQISTKKLQKQLSFQ
jgi:hypothetical protein